MAKNNVTVDRIQAVWNKLGGEEGVSRLLRGELVVSAAKGFETPVRKTVKLGTCTSPDEYRKALKKAGRGIGEWCDDILARISCSQDEVDLDLVVMSVGDLGFEHRVSTNDVCAKAVEFGFELCPAEVGPALRLQYGDQPKGELILVGMKPITDQSDRKLIFSVTRSENGDFCLDTDAGYPGTVWGAGARFVFVRRK